MKSLIREVEINDASGMMVLKKRLATETKFMMRELEEVNDDLDFETEMIRNICKNQNQVLWISKVDDDIAGYVMIENYDFIRRKHISYLIIGIQKKYWSRGIGQELLEKAIQWAELRKLKRVELEVVAENHKAISFYKKNGFVEEGRKRKDHYIGNGEYLDSLIMCKVL